ncbi:MAG: hypothetical protein RMM29_06530 [Planctomycetota bacterium]|nr:hypothetical protein [Planctomycetota bacterium]MCX8040524.1 hypothetical protein [Planctomycetota bacterium]MDW8373285.1 hypothetical protein [Planctomycetota bacterium]
MQHSAARGVVVRALSGSGFAQSAVAAVLCAELAEQKDSACPASVVAALASQVQRAAADLAPPQVHPLNQQSLPADQGALIAQLMPLLIAHPAAPAEQLAALWALSRLWSHTAVDERARLRTAFINSCLQWRCPPEAMLTTLQLRQWQKDMPTQFGSAAPSLARLRAALNEPQAFAAYLRFVEHIGLQPDLETLCWVLGSLVIVQLLEWHDDEGTLAHLVFATAALERWAPALPLDLTMTALTQLFHRLWWLRHHGNLRAIRRSTDPSLRPFAAAVASGDLTLAQRAARALISQRPESYWAAWWPTVAAWLPEATRDVLRLLLLSTAVRWRCGHDPPSHDDAAALATLVSEFAWCRQAHRSSCIAAS